MRGHSPDDAEVPTPLTRLLRNYMADRSLRLRDVTRPPSGNKTGAPARATMSYYLKDGMWLQQMPRPTTLRQLAVAVGADQREVEKAAWLSLESNRGRPENDPDHEPVAPHDDSASFVSTGSGGASAITEEELLIRLDRARAEQDAILDELARRRSGGAGGA